MYFKFLTPQSKAFFLPLWQFSPLFKTVSFFMSISLSFGNLLKLIIYKVSIFEELL